MSPIKQVSFNCSALFIHNGSSNIKAIEQHDKIVLKNNRNTEIQQLHTHIHKKIKRKITNKPTVR